MNNLKKKISLFLVLTIFISLFCPLFAYTKDDVININSIKDYEKVVKICEIDSGSYGKTINLNCDISFKGKEFKPIPIFNGIFNGNGYAFTNVDFKRAGSSYGLIRYVKKDGVVKNLRVEGNFTPKGSKSKIGGIAGENEGKIISCCFDGYIKAENDVGGITGINKDTGEIISCYSYGTVIGENATGGIAGRNHGYIRDCENSAVVNTIFEEKKKELQDINTDPGEIVENYKTKKDEAEEDKSAGHTDTGGIAGISDGIIGNSINLSKIGYQHVGYNVGGIAGRQSGYIVGCTNFGHIDGRKDVGGICGQVEPYIILSNKDENINKIRSDLKSLHGRTDKLITDIDNTSNGIGNHLSNISRYSKEAIESADGIFSDTTDFIDDNLGEINTKAAILSDAMDRLSDVFVKISDGGKEIKDAVSSLNEAIDSLEFNVPSLFNEAQDMKLALNRFSLAFSKAERAIKGIETAKNNLKDAIKIQDDKKVINAIADLYDGIHMLVKSYREISDALSKLPITFRENEDGFQSIGIDGKKVGDKIEDLLNNFKNVVTSLEKINASLDTLKKNVSIDFDDLKNAAGEISDSIELIRRTFLYLSHGFDYLESAIYGSYRKLNRFTAEAEEVINEAKKHFSESLSFMGYGIENIEEASKDLGNILKDLSEEKTLEFVRPSEEFREKSKKLFNSVTDISNELDDLKNTIDFNGDFIKDDLRKINNLFDEIMNLVVSEIYDSDEFELITDISDTDIKSSKQGKLDKCKNKGKISGDRNVGGISGAMSIEYEKDREKDIEKPDNIKFTYKTKAIIYECINDGDVSGKKDFMGGITGYSELGSIFNSQNYGDIKTASGNYIGGIAGIANATLYNCYSKSKVEGENYVGGITGKGKVLSNCYSIPKISGQEYLGSIIGYTDDLSRIYNNFYVDDGIGAIDLISYKGKAEPITYEKLKTYPVPERFLSFVVTFMADGNKISEIEVPYMEETKNIKLPKPPLKNGKFGKWEEFKDPYVTNNIRIECEFMPYITVLESKEKDGKLSIALAEGEFTDDAYLNIKENKDPKINKLKKNSKSYDVLISKTNITENDNVTLRILNKDKKKMTAYIYKDGKLEEIKTRNRGKYVIIDTKGKKNTIILKPEKSFTVYIIIGISLILVALIIIILKKRKNKGAV